MARPNSPSVAPSAQAAMFESLGRRYELVNRIVTLGSVQRWRLALTKEVSGDLLDLCSGTGQTADALAPGSESVVMLDVSARLVGEGNHPGVAADACLPPFADGSFDTVSVAFGVRNLHSLTQGLSGIYRVLRPEGRLLVLEMRGPEGLLRFPYRLYIHAILPLKGLLVGVGTEPYRYLARSIESFPRREEFIALLERAGFAEVEYRDLTLGAATLFIARKR